MTLTVNAKAFDGAIRRVRSAVRPDPKSYPILSTIHLSAAEGVLTLRSTDLDIEIAETIDATGELAPICIDGARLSAITAKLAADARREMIIRPEGTEGDVTIESGKASFKLQSLSAESFPTLQSPEMLASFELDGALIAKTLTLITPAMSSESTRYYLCGVYFEPVPAKKGAPARLQLTATDGHKMFTRALEVSDDLDGMLAIIVPDFMVNALVKLLAKVELATFRCSETKIEVTFGRTRMLSKLIEGTYPDWRRVSPISRESTHSFDREDLLQAVTLTSAAVNVSVGMKVEIEEGEAKFTATDRENPGFSGSASAAVSALGAKPQVTIGVNPDYLEHAIAFLDAETIEFAIEDGGSPLLFRGAGKADRFAVIMPMRV